MATIEYYVCVYLSFFAFIKVGKSCGCRFSFTFPSTHCVELWSNFSGRHEGMLSYGNAVKCVEVFLPHLL